METKSPISFQNTVCSDVHVDTTIASRCSYHSNQLFESKWFLHIKITSQNIPGLSQQNNKSADERRLDGFAWLSSDRSDVKGRANVVENRVGKDTETSQTLDFTYGQQEWGTQNLWLLERRLCNKTDFSPPHSNVSLPGEAICDRGMRRWWPSHS